MELQSSNPLLFVPWQVVYKYCNKSFINKPTFLNFVPQLIRKIYHVSTARFYRFACVIVVQAHISLMTRLVLETSSYIIF